eukprot:TRINITY_DN53936_c0_g1_i1.p1 TRINITY_DN53936_c0_g1~~TRINITY_DN53936_c0_g1_i1.p1  ORF type:complete len:623 (-),score=86.65 TRINITY_DN53936_c0_g1_i1:28-1896(-)
MIQLNESDYLRLFSGATLVDCDYTFLDQLSYEYCLPNGFTSAADFFEYIRGRPDTDTQFGSTEQADPFHNGFGGKSRFDREVAISLSQYFGGDEHSLVFELPRAVQKDSRHVGTTADVHESRATEDDADEVEESGSEDEDDAERRRRKRLDIFGDKERPSWIIATETYGSGLHPLLCRWRLFDKRSRLYSLIVTKNYTYREPLGPMGNYRGMHRGNFQALIVRPSNDQGTKPPLTMYRWMLRNEASLPIPLCDLPPDAKTDRAFPKIGTTLVRRAARQCAQDFLGRSTENEYEAADRLHESDDADEDSEESSSPGFLDGDSETDGFDQERVQSRTYHVYFDEPPISILDLEGKPHGRSGAVAARMRADTERRHTQSTANLRTKIAKMESDIERERERIARLKLTMEDDTRRYEERAAQEEQKRKRRRAEMEESGRKGNGMFDFFLDMPSFELSPADALMSAKGRLQQSEEKLNRVRQELRFEEYWHSLQARDKPVWKKPGLRRLRQFLEKDRRLKESDQSSDRNTYTEYLKAFGACRGAVQSSIAMWTKEYPAKERRLESLYYTKIWYQKLSRSAPYFVVGKLSPVLLIQRRWREYTYRPDGQGFKRARADFQNTIGEQQIP